MSKLIDKMSCKCYSVFVKFTNLNMLSKLIEFGLSDKEAKVYLALIELGPSSVTHIARRAKVSRTNTYHLLNALHAAGLVTSKEGESKIIYSAERPDKLVLFLKAQLYDAQKRLKMAEGVLPDLETLYKDPDKKISVRYLEGKEGVIAAYEDTLTAKSEILAYGSVDEAESFFPGYLDEYFQRRTEKKISVKSIFAACERSFQSKKRDKLLLRKTHLVPESFQIKPEINVYDDKVAIMSLKENFGVVIESKDVSDAFRKMFVLAYEKAEEYDKEIMKNRGLEIEKKSKKK